MRRLGGVCLLALGVIGVLAGVAVMVLFGTDNRLETGPHELRSRGAAITTAPQAIKYAGPRVELTVTSRGERRNLFVGVAHHVDVQDLLGSTRRTRVDRIDLPWAVSTSTVGEGGSPRTAPGDVDWWYAKEEGRGRAVLTWTLPDAGGDVVIIDQEGHEDLAVDVTAAWVVRGVFVVGAAAVVIGLGVAVFGWALLSSRVRPRGTHADRTPAVADRT